MYERDIRLFVIERDFYARQALIGYLSLDRRTHVLGDASVPCEMIAAQMAEPDLAYLDLVLLDAGLAADAHHLCALIATIQQHVPEADVLCLAQAPDRELALAARQAGACGYLVRERVGIGIAWAIYFSTCHPFVITSDVALLLRDERGQMPFSATVLPGRRQYPNLTDRVEQALRLCVVEGLPAALAADEMGISTSTVRSYIKEGYRILETHDDTIYPIDLSPAERAFLRYTAIDAPREPAA